ncbi:MULTISPECIES: LysR family transcriptional regulator [Bacillus]|uniref:LysR family transcriptional regulator n=1 Tax=Bacillus TaxID=1386 RepID=UPI0001A1C8EB|nr:MULTISPECIES: LysR family transcriptional regulator [Bacillus]ARZ65204.1 LysR family transcriptional regulator [Bacillus thuringiensis]EEM69132.1 LysR substrate-binding [Bacillus thuringiensis serovar andalousiensis BGSC 4AW1]MCU5030075.1 LysR family transcriptional regulator [Bacillus cereus]MDD8003188.1 LysR family transcriptional regulator [Bacillus cereus]MEB9505811.1 LysR family transcriptional regulator [Bacillus anthracis]
MELLQLKYFKTVARTEHITKAAQELHISQPALSVTISRLEEELGVPLFDRIGRKIQLNTFGKAFLKQVDTALEALEVGKRQVTDMAGLEHGSVFIATTTLNRVSELLTPFLALYPHINFRITQASTEELKVQLLEKGEIDFCFTPSPIEQPGIYSLPLMTEEIVLAVPSTHRLKDRHRIKLSEVADDPFISLKPGYSFREITDNFCRLAGFTPNIVCEGDEPAAISGLVRTGLGVAFLPIAAKKELPPLTLLHIEEPICQWTSHLLWNEKHYLSLAAQTFREFVVQHYAQVKP